MRAGIQRQTITQDGLDITLCHPGMLGGLIAPKIHSFTVDGATKELEPLGGGDPLRGTVEVDGVAMKMTFPSKQLIIRRFRLDEQMVIVFECKGVTATRLFSRVEG